MISRSLIFSISPAKGRLAVTCSWFDMDTHQLWPGRSRVILWTEELTTDDRRTSLTYLTARVDERTTIPKKSLSGHEKQTRSWRFMISNNKMIDLVLFIVHVVKVSSECPNSRVYRFKSTETLKLKHMYRDKTHGIYILGN